MFAMHLKCSSYKLTYQGDNLTRENFIFNFYNSKNTGNVALK